MRTARGLSRRQFIGLAGLLGAGALSSPAAAAIDRALNADPAGAGSIADIDHIVVLMQENRSFDHYFGTMSAVRGFDDMSTSMAQAGFRPGRGPDPSGRLMPFHLDTVRHPRADPDVLNDPSHSWTTQHASWNGGAMDAWVETHLASDGPAYAPEVMGYYTRADIPTHYALADAFTVCDNYFSSVLGPTAPNRLYWMTGTLDPDGVGGGPITAPIRRVPNGTLTWTTFPEVLTDAGVSWKVYNSGPPQHSSELTGMLKYFRAFRKPGSELYERGITPLMHDFHSDVASGQLPAVSWLIPQMRSSEHPSYPPASGANGIMSVLNALTSNPAVWERTALIVSYDENGGFFDHVRPPTPAQGTAGEFVHGQPIGLGFRVPAMVISPYSRGGNVFSDILDHTSQLRLIGARFDVPVPNLTPWRAAAVGDLTGAFLGHPVASALPSARRASSAAHEAVTGDARVIAAARVGRAPRYPVPANSMPRQARAPARRFIG